jgi:Domain of unknown function (DUF4307)
MKEPVDPIAARYGRKSPNKKLIAVFVGLALAIFLVWAAWVSFAGSQPQGKTISYEIWNEQTTVVDFSVNKPKERSVTCSVKALSEDYAVVGYKEVQFPAGESYIVSTVTLTTVRKAVTGLVDGCWFD